MLERLWGTRDRWWAALLTGVGMAAAMAALADSSWGGALEDRLGLAVMFRARGAVPPPAEVVIVAMNDESAARISLPIDTMGFHLCRDLAVDSLNDGRQPLPSPRTGQWPRCVHAELVNALATAGARLVVFDVSFRPRPLVAIEGADIMRLQDLRFADAMRAAGNTLLVQRVDFAAGAGPYATVCSSASPVEISAPIRDAAMGVAPFLPVASDRIDRFATFVACGWSSPTLPMLALQAGNLDAYSVLRQEALASNPGEAAFLPELSTGRLSRGALESATLQLRRLLADSPMPSPAAQRRGRGGVAVLRALYGGPELHYFNHYGPPGSIEHWNYSDVLARARTDPASLRRSFQGRVVFVGYAEYTHPEQTEHFLTPFMGSDGIAVSGVELLATAYGNLAQEHSIRPTGHRPTLAAAWAFATVCICLLLPALWGAGITGIAFAVFGGTASLVFSQHGVWLPVVVPALAWALSFVLALAIQYRDMVQRHRRVQRIVEHFVPPDVARQLQMPSGLTPRTTEAIVMATDVTNYVMLAESMEARDLRALLNQYFEVIFRCVLDHGGFISDVVGDSMVAIWTARPGEVLPREAVLQACVDIQLAVESSELGKLLPTRIGVSAGTVELGMVGALNHYEFRAVGRPVNEANRLQALNKTMQTRVLVTHEVEEMQGARFAFRNLGTVQIRGKPEPVIVFELMGRRS